MDEQKLQLAALNQQQAATEAISVKPKGAWIFNFSLTPLNLVFLVEASFQSDIPIVPAAIRWKEIEDIKVTTFLWVTDCLNH